MTNDTKWSAQLIVKAESLEEAQMLADNAVDFLNAIEAVVLEDDDVAVVGIVEVYEP